MKRIRAIIALFSLAVAANAAAQSLPSARPVAEGREPARSEIIAYPTLDEALSFGRGETRYLQPLVWEHTLSGRGEVFTAEYTMPFAWLDREQFLHVEGASGAYEVQLNGSFAGAVQNGSTPADFDLTKLALEGKNRLTITVLNDPVAERLESRPAGGTPQLGACYVMAQPRMHVRDITVNSSIENQTNGILELGVVVKTHALNPRTSRIYYALYAPDSTRVVEGYKDLTLGMRGEDTVRFLATVPRSMVWSAEHPNLYTLVVRTRFEGRDAEFIPFKVGFRSVTLRDGRLLVNGEAVDFKVRDVRPDISAEELSSLKQLGYNTLRLTDGRFPRELLNRCDSIGMYVVSQTPIDTSAAGASIARGGNPSNDPQQLAAYLDRTESNYHAAKNHPSVIAFSLAHDSANGINLYESYLLLKRLEAHRPVIYPEAGGEWNSDTVTFGD